MLVDRYQEAFLRRASYILHSQEMAEDAVQDTFLKIYKYTDSFSERKNASFNSWAYRILTNTCYSYASQKKVRTERVVNLEFDALDAAGQGEVMRGDDLSVVESLLSRLPVRLSRLLTLYFFEEKSYEEIATIEEISLSAVKSGLHRAKKQLKEVAININTI